MSNYGRNFEFRVPPRSGERSGRYYLSGSTARPIGAPVVLDGGAANALGLESVALATGDQIAPKAGEGGVLVYEYGPAAFAGNDPALTTYSDMDTVDGAAACQVVSGETVKIVLRNTSDETFLNVRSYTGRTMIAGLGTTSSVAVGDYLTPGAGDDDNGYWQETVTAANAWADVTKVDNDRGEVEARLTF